MNLHYFKTSKENIWNCYQCMYHKVFNYILLYHFPFVRKNILTTMLVQICSTTLRFCTSPNTPIGIWSCYWHKNHANTLLQNHPPRHGAHLKVLLPYEFTLLQNWTFQNLKRILVLLPYEFTLLQNLKRGYLKLLPVYVSQDIQLHFNISLPFCQKNILSAMLVQICSTTLQSCTSSNAQIGIWSCYRHKKHAITLLQNYDRVAAMYVSVLLPYEFTLLQNRNAFLWYKETVLLPYEFTLLQNSTSTYYTGANYFTTLQFCTSLNA